MKKMNYQERQLSAMSRLQAYANQTLTVTSHKMDSEGANEFDGYVTLALLEIRDVLDHFFDLVEGLEDD